MKRLFTSRLFATFGFLLFTTSILPAQTTWFVMPGAPGTGSGNGWANPIDFQTAVNSAGAGDNIFVAQGIYQPASGQSFVMKEGVNIYGGFQGTETALSQRLVNAGYISTLKGNGARVVYNNANGLSAAALLDGFTITNGTAGYGAGMMNVSASPTIRNCIFSANNGGGMWNAYSSATIVNCVFTGNTGTVTSYAGGIGNASSSGVSVINCIFSGNTGSLGGGIYIDDIAPTSNNIINCTFWGNTATSTSVAAGGIYCNSRACPTIQNCIIWGNSSGIHTVTTTTPPVITNNIIQGGYLNNLKVDPLFVNTGNPAGPDNIWGTADDGLMVQTGSPAYNAGTADITGLHLPGTDIAGAARVQGGKIDIGAYESSFSCSAFTTMYVDSSIAVSGDGSSWATAFKTFDQGLLAASQCNVVTSICVAKGTYPVAASNSFGMLSHVQIFGGFPGGGGSFSQRNNLTNTSILQGNGNSVIYNTNIDATALLDGFTITGGITDYGGGMLNYNASPTINNCIFLNNTVSYSGGGMYNRGASSPLISNCVFSGNSASTTGSNGGGAILNNAASPVMMNCIFYNNTADYGGAIYNNRPTNAIIRNSVFAGNTSVNDAAAIANYGNALTLSNVTFANNTAGGGGGAIDNYGSALTVTNSIFWGNASSDANKDIWWETGTPNINYSFTQVSWTGTGNILGSSSPFLNASNPAGADGIWMTNDDGLSLQAGSPCINAGTPDTTGLTLGNTDIAGNPRIVGAAIDMGAYEYNSTPLPITLLSFTGRLDKGMANLQWISGVESNFNHFEVEKSTDNSIFLAQGEIPGKGSGSNYTFSTPQPEPAAYYRLKLVDNDGGAAYSRIVRLSLSQSADNNILFYPNPATDIVNIKVANAGSVSIYTADGKLVKTQTILAGLNVVNVSQLSAGLYYGMINGTIVHFIKK
jgi:parallel beta helix pectate lyase-like protein/type IX secretion system substrate protein